MHYTLNLTSEFFRYEFNSFAQELIIKSIFTEIILIIFAKKIIIYPMRFSEKYMNH